MFNDFFFFFFFWILPDSYISRAKGSKEGCERARACVGVDMCVYVCM